VLVRVGQADDFDQPRLERVVDREVRDQPLEERPLGPGRARAVPGGRREVEHQAHARGLADALEDLAPLDVLGVLALPAALRAVDVVRLVVDDHEVAPAAEQPPDRRVRVLPRAALHRAQHRLRDEAPLLERHLTLADPVLALRLERDALPVAHEHVRVELAAVPGRDHLERVVEVVLAGRIEPVAARLPAHPVAHRQVRHQDEEVRRERRAAHLALVQRRPGHDERHHHGLAGAGGEFERVAQEVARLGHPATVLHLVEVDDRLDRLLLAEEEALAEGLALLVAVEPPLQELPRDQRRARPTGLAPRAHLVAELVDEVVPLGSRCGEVVEELRLLADDPADAALDVLCRGEEAHRRPAALHAPGAAARQQRVVRVGFAEGVADDDAVDDVGHGSYLVPFVRFAALLARAVFSPD
jgi:hypothetical protein